MKISKTRVHVGSNSNKQLIVPLKNGDYLIGATWVSAFDSSATSTSYLASTLSWLLTCCYVRTTWRVILVGIILCSFMRNSMVFVSRIKYITFGCLRSVTPTHWTSFSALEAKSLNMDTMHICIVNSFSIWLLLKCRTFGLRTMTA